MSERKPLQCTYLWDGTGGGANMMARVYYRGGVVEKIEPCQGYEFPQVGVSPTLAQENSQLREALRENARWLRAALDCENFAWDVQQWNAAHEEYKAGQIALSQHPQEAAQKVEQSQSHIVTWLARWIEAALSPEWQWSEDTKAAAKKDVDTAYQLLAAQKVERESGWLIEQPARHGRPLWYQLGSELWLDDASQATRFARKQDAEAYIRGHLLRELGAIATEHVWVDAALTSEAQEGER